MKWLIYLGLIGSMLGSVYLQTMPVPHPPAANETPTWSGAGYSLTPD